MLCVLHEAPAPRTTPSQFTLVVSASDSSINGTSLYATNNNEIDIQGILEPAEYATSASIFYFDSTSGDLVTDSDLTGGERLAYTLYSNFTSSLRFDLASDIWGSIYYPKFTIADDGTFSAGSNLTWGWCPDEFNVGDGYYLPGSITLGAIAEGCEAIDGLIAVDASS